MTTTPERLATLENEMKNLTSAINKHIKCTDDKIEKLNKKIQTKADKMEVDKINNKLWVIAGTTILTLLTVVGFLFSLKMGWL